jgi:hypothetical protein
MKPAEEPWRVLGSLLQEEEEIGQLIDPMEDDALFGILEAVEAFNALMRLPSLMTPSNPNAELLRRDLLAWRAERAKGTDSGP